MQRAASFAGLPIAEPQMVAMVRRIDQRVEGRPLILIDVAGERVIVLEQIVDGRISTA